MDRPLHNGKAQEASISNDVGCVDSAFNDGLTLEAMELEFALGAIDVLTEGFDMALVKAAERVGGRVLFNMPALDTTNAQRIGAIAIPGQPQDQVIFVTLRNDGTTLSLDPLSGDNSVFVSLGNNYAAVMKSLFTADDTTNG